MGKQRIYSRWKQKITLSNIQAYSSAFGSMWPQKEEKSCNHGTTQLTGGGGGAGTGPGPGLLNLVLLKLMVWAGASHYKFSFFSVKWSCWSRAGIFKLCKAKNDLSFLFPVNPNIGLNQIQAGGWGKWRLPVCPLIWSPLSCSCNPEFPGIQFENLCCRHFLRLLLALKCEDSMNPRAWTV